MQSHFSTILSNLLSGFREGYSTQHALFRVIETRKQCLDFESVVGALIMDLSKAYDCIPHDLLIAKLEAYKLDKRSLKIMLNYKQPYSKIRDLNMSKQYGSFRDLCLGPCILIFLY